VLLIGAVAFFESKSLVSFHDKFVAAHAVFKRSASAEREMDADVDPVQAKREMTMQKLVMTALLAGAVAATSIQMSHAAGVGAVGVGAPSSGSTASGTTTRVGNGGLGNEAGSIAAGANSALNPSGNSFIVPPPGEAVGGVAAPRAPR
jgi:hypothetical protein